MSRLVVVALMSLLWIPHVAAQTSLGLAPAQSAGVSEAGRRLTFVCPATDGAGASVYGTDVYTAESSVCPAAIHAGVLKPKQAGTVSILIGSGAKAFTGSTRNGVTTKSYGAWPTSFTFVTDTGPGTINWRTTWSQIPREFTQPVSLVCPPGGQLGGVAWGTDIYTRDSTICVAAVHAGVITLEKGGEITVTRVANATPFKASERFGVKTATWSAQPDAFSVTAARPAAVAVASAVPPPAQAPSTAGVLMIPPSGAIQTGVTLSPVAASAGTASDRVREERTGTSLVRNTSAVTATVRGLAVTVSWSPVLGASWYGVAGESQWLWRQVQAPTTSVTYFLPFGNYTFAVGTYFEPGPTTTPAAEWPRATASVVPPTTPQQQLEYQESLVELEKWRAELEKKGEADPNIMETLAKLLDQLHQTNLTIGNAGR